MLPDMPGSAVSRLTRQGPESFDVLQVLGLANMLDLLPVMGLDLPALCHCFAWATRNPQIMCTVIWGQ